jgi:hypothetical protein
VTWSDPTPTDITNAPSAFDLHRVANGKFALCFNAENISTNIREKLALMVFKSRGAAVAAYKVIDGLGMLVNQGVIGIKHWAGIDPDPKVMRKALEDIFNS